MRHGAGGGVHGHWRASCLACRDALDCSFHLLQPTSALHRLCPLAVRPRAGRALPLWLFVLRESKALSRGWCMPLTRGSAVCEQNASHNTQILACFSR